MKRQRGGYHLFAQVSLGEIIGADDPLEYACVNSKRCDFVVIDPNGYPALAIEYQGSGHYTANADERDTVKRLALEGAFPSLKSWNTTIGRRCSMILKQHLVCANRRDPFKPNVEQALIATD